MVCVCVCVLETGKHTVTRKQMQRGFMLITRQIWHYPHRDVVFISLPLPPTIPSDHNSLCPDKPREREGETETEKSRKQKKMERWRKREQPTDHIMVVASVIWLIQSWERETSVWLLCVFGLSSANFPSVAIKNMIYLNTFCEHYSNKRKQETVTV